MNICFEYMIHIMSNKTDNMNKNEYKDYTLVYKNENEKKLFMSDFNYKETVQDFNLEIEKYSEKIDNLHEFVKKNPTYDNLINYRPQINKLSDKLDEIKYNKNLLNNCLQIEKHFEDFYKEKIRKDEFQKNIYYDISSYKPFVQCKPYLRYKFKNRLNIDFTGVVYDNLKKQRILNKKICKDITNYNRYTGFKYLAYNWKIVHDFDNGYYYKITENYNQKEPKDPLIIYDE